MNRPSTARSGSAHASRTWRWARRPCATSRSRARSSAAGDASYSDSSPLRCQERRPPAGPGGELDDLAGHRQGVEPAPGGVELGVPGRVVDRRRARTGRGAGTSRRTRGRAPRSRRPSRRRGRRRAAVAVRCPSRHGSRPPRPGASSSAPLRRPLRQGLAQPEPQESVVAGLADAVRAQLRPALEVVRSSASA